MDLSETEGKMVFINNKVADNTVRRIFSAIGIFLTA